MSYGINAPESGNGNYANGLLGWLAPLVSGLIGGQNMKRDRQEHAQDREELQKENALKDTSQDLANQTSQQQIADAKLKHQLDMTSASVARGGTALNAVFANPALASNPEIIKSVTESNQVQGLPTQFNKDGSLNANAMRKPVTEMDSKQLTYILGLDPKQRKPLLDAAQKQGYDIPHDMYTNTEVVSAKDRASFERNKATMGHYADEATWQAARNTTRNKYYDELGALIPGREGLLAADTLKAQASASAIITNANAAATRAQAYAQRVQGEVTRWKQNPAGNTSTMRTLLSNSTSELGQLHTALNDAEKNLTTVGMTSPADDDPTFLQAQSTVAALQQQVKEATDADSQMRASLMGNPNVAASAGAASGFQATNVSPPTGAPAEGQHAVSKSGKPIVFKGGKWEYK